MQPIKPARSALRADGVRRSTHVDFWSCERKHEALVEAGGSACEAIVWRNRAMYPHRLTCPSSIPTLRPPRSIRFADRSIRRAAMIL